MSMKTEDLLGVATAALLIGIVVVEGCRIYNKKVNIPAYVHRLHDARIALAKVQDAYNEKHNQVFMLKYEAELLSAKLYTFATRNVHTLNEFVVAGLEADAAVMINRLKTNDQ